jgi:hypothetical protein
MTGSADPIARGGEAKVSAADALARFGTAEPVVPPRSLSLGPVSFLVADGAVRSLAFEGVEVIRGLAYPIRDADWGTAATTTVSEDVSEAGGTLCYRRIFTAGYDFDGDFRITVTLDRSGVGVAATLCLAALRDVVTNRSGFVILHPLRGVAGEPMEARRPDGSVERLAFPRLVSPAQPVRDLAGLAHRVDGVEVDIAFSGEVFEMEDQRNWTDASYKTYCRPLALPRPYTVTAGDRVEQEITVRLRRTPPGAAGSDKAAAAIGPRGAPGIAASAAGRNATASVAKRGAAAPSRAGAPGASVAATGDAMAALPAITLAVDETIAPVAPAVAALREVAFAGALVRCRPDGTGAALAAARPLGVPVTLELVMPAGASPAAELDEAATGARGSGIAPHRVVALPEAYLASIQPEGPWPAPTPEDAVEAVARAFPEADAGGGVLTFFTELNRCPPKTGRFVTFGTAAIVHAADDASVLETLEALPDVFATAARIAGERPLHLGLVGIGMRSNPYGASTAANPDGRRVAMALADPRQRGLFAAAFAVGAMAAAARAGVASLSLGMGDGPLGLTENGAARPIFHVARALARLSGPVPVEGEAGGTVRVGPVVANLSAAPVAVDGLALTATTVAAARDPLWLDRARPGRTTLQPLDVAFLGDPS